MFLKRARGEMADTLALGASAASRRGSNPLGRIMQNTTLYSSWCFISIFLVLILSDLGSFIVKTPFTKVANDFSV